LSSLNSDHQLSLYLSGERELTFPGDIVKDTYIEILSIPHFVIQDDLPLEVKDRDMGPIECNSGLVTPCAPSIKDARHDGLYKWQ
jgi:hypothetical protein